MLFAYQMTGRRTTAPVLAYVDSRNRLFWNIWNIGFILGLKSPYSFARRLQCKPLHEETRCYALPKQIANMRVVTTDQLLRLLGDYNLPNKGIFNHQAIIGEHVYDVKLPPVPLVIPTNRNVGLLYQEWLTNFKEGARRIASKNALLYSDNDDSSPAISLEEPPSAALLPSESSLPPPPAVPSLLRSLLSAPDQPPVVSLQQPSPATSATCPQLPSNVPSSLVPIPPWEQAWSLPMPPAAPLTMPPPNPLPSKPEPQMSIEEIVEFLQEHPPETFNLVPTPTSERAGYLTTPPVAPPTVPPPNFLPPSAEPHMSMEEISGFLNEFSPETRTHSSPMELSVRGSLNTPGQNPLIWVSKNINNIICVKKNNEQCPSLYQKITLDRDFLKNYTACSSRT